MLSSYESCAPASASSASMTSRTRPRIEYCVPVGAFFCDHAVHGSRLLSANNRVFCLVDVLARRFRPAPFVGWPRQSVLVWFARACGVMIKQSLMVGSFVLLLAISWTSSSLARVECKGDFQVTKYVLITTPWGEEENIVVHFLRRPRKAWKNLPRRCQSFLAIAPHGCRILGAARKFRMALADHLGIRGRSSPSLAAVSLHLLDKQLT